MRRPLLRWAPPLLLGLLLALPAGAHAQVTRADSAAVLLDAARALEARGAGGAAEALLRLVAERYAGTPGGAQAADLLAALGARRRVAVEEGSGRTELLVFGPLYGAWVGIALPLALGIDDPAEEIGVGLLLGTPAGFLAGRAWADAARPSVGQARAVTFGGTWGTWQGIGWQSALDLGTKEECFEIPEPRETYCEETDDERALFASALAGGVAGIALGAWLASRADITPATATLVNFGALWGTWYGAVGAVQAGFDDDDDADRLLTTMLLAGDAGLLATALLAPGWDMSRSRARIINIAGVGGLAAGFGIDLLVQSEDLATVLLIPALTSAAGLALGALRTRGMDDAGDAPGDAPGAALFELRRGRLALGVPAPQPVLLREALPGGRPTRSPGVRLQLLHALF